jgi:hypothetical protein
VNYVRISKEVTYKTSQISVLIDESCSQRT